jgi:predicted DNA-binding protein
MNLMLRLSDEERALLEALASATGLTKADVLRQSMRAEAKRRGVPVIVKKKQKRSK